MTDQWETFTPGGYPGATVYLTVHKACGALIGDSVQHEKVCTAPPWEPPPSRIGETHDWEVGS